MYFPAVHAIAVTGYRHVHADCLGRHFFNRNLIVFVIFEEIPAVGYQLGILPLPIRILILKSDSGRKLHPRIAAIPVHLESLCRHIGIPGILEPVLAACLLRPVAPAFACPYVRACRLKISIVNAIYILPVRRIV